MVNALKKKLFNNSSPEDKKCGVCLEQVTDFDTCKITDCCGTIFHSNCIKNLNSCAMCRTPVKVLNSKQKIIKDLMSIRYFYCSAFGCYEIKEDNSIFCIDHTICNCQKLKVKADEIPRHIVKKMILSSINEDIGVSKTDLFFINFQN